MNTAEDGTVPWVRGAAIWGAVTPPPHGFLLASGLGNAPAAQYYSGHSYIRETAGAAHDG